jgi:hypothetical protein
MEKSRRNQHQHKTRQEIRRVPDYKPASAPCSYYWWPIPDAKIRAITLSRRRSNPVPDVICNQCHQCAEKYLLATLNPYGIDIRSPGLEATIAEAREAVKMMKEVRKFVRSKLGLRAK